MDCFIPSDNFKLFILYLQTFKTEELNVLYKNRWLNNLYKSSTRLHLTNC